MGSTNGTHEGLIMALKDLTHGMSKTRQYKTWLNMKARCNKDSHDYYENYGGRGITYDNRWESFEGFWSDMYVGYSDDMTLERVDVNGNYCKENCKWVPARDQAKNRTKPINNTSGKTGVDFHFNRIGVEYARARWAEGGKLKVRYFSCKKYGKDNAFEMAIKFRKTKLEEMGYGEFHGE